jgi:hypothetical protein
MVAVPTNDKRMEAPMDWNEIDLEFLEQEAEDRLSERDAMFLGLPADFGMRFLERDANAHMLQA